MTKGKESRKPKPKDKEKAGQENEEKEFGDLVNALLKVPPKPKQPKNHKK